jgi:WS/DGAT/MGAT family acyltransferase
MALVDLEPEPRPERTPPAWHPSPPPAPNRLLADSVVEELGQPLRVARRLGETVAAPGKAGAYLSNLGRALVRLGGAAERASWNTTVSAHRRWTTARVPMEAVRAVRKGRRGTLNDVVLAACSGALRGFLDERGEDVRPLKAMVPVSRRADNERDTLGNRVSMILVDLAVEVDHPRERLNRIHQQTSELKGSGLVDGAEAVIVLADQVLLFAAPLTRFLTQRIPMNLVITNVPGPPVPLYLRGSRLREVFPYVEVVDNEGLTIALVSYDDTLFFGLTADRDVVPDLDSLAAGIERSFDELARAVAPTKRKKQTGPPAA